MSFSSKDYSDSLSTDRLVLDHENTSINPLIDLHVYKVPLDIWRDRFNNLLNQSVCETVSLGIIRVPPDLMLCDVRNELNRQLDDLVPAEFVFLRSVGRSLTKLKAKQEYEIKAKYFLPPTAYAPELYLLEAGADVGSSLASDSSSRAHSRNHSTEREGRPGYNSYRAGPYDSRYTQTKGGNENTPQARDMWKKRYFEEKKRTAPLEDQTNRLRHELEAIHRKLMSTLEGPKDGRQIKYIDGKPSPKNNYIIQCTRLQHEIEDLRRRSENAKMKLTAEMKLRNQADAELRALRAELTQKKINLTLSRNQQLAALNPGVDGNDSLTEVAVEN